MAKQNEIKIDEIGYWSEVKLDILRDYAKAYSTILTNQPELQHVYIDAFAGAGHHISKNTGSEIPGSPQVAVSTDPPFTEYHFIDLDGLRVENLRRMFAGRMDVTVYHGDCNEVLLDQVYPNVRYENYRRGLCILDPYGLQLNWPIMSIAGAMKSLDVFLNFPIMDMNRNVFWKNPDKVPQSGIRRMNAFWGDESWRDVAYEQEETLFGMNDVKAENDVIAEAFRVRLQTVGGFAEVLTPMPMRNTQGATVYYLYFASQKPVAAKIVRDIFRKYANRELK